MATEFSYAFSFTVTNFAKNSVQITSRPFRSGGCEWIVDLTGRCGTNYFSLYLLVNEPKSLGLNWKRKVSFYFVLKTSGQETFRRQSGNISFSANSSRWGWKKAFPLKKVLGNMVSINASFVVEIYMKVIKVVDGNNVLSSQVPSVKQLLQKISDVAKEFRSKNQVLKTEYMNVLLRLVETVKKPLKSISETEEQVKKLELTVSGLKTELANEKANFLSLKEVFSDLRVELEKEKAKSTAKVLSDLEVEQDQKKTKSTKVFSWSGLKGNSEITANLLSWEDGEDLVSSTKYLEIQQKKYDYKTIN